MKFLDLTRQDFKEELEAVERVLRSGRYILGPEVEAFEHEVANYLGAKYALGVSSGTDALLVSLMALGIGPGDEVITSPYTFVATAEAIARCGATPVFVDVDKTYNLDPSLVMQHVTKKTRVILPVHSFGRSADLSWVSEARKIGLKTVEDAAQSIGSKWMGKSVGTIGDLGCFSFFPSKNLGCCGDGGLVVTNNEDYYNKIKSLRSHGVGKRYYHSQIGGNFRLDEIQAAILRVRLRHLDVDIEKRRDIACKITTVLGKRIIPGHVYNQIVLQVHNRDKVRQDVLNLGIETEVYYPCPLHLQECFGYLGYRRGDLPVSEFLADHALAIPCNPFLTPEEISTLCEFFSGFSDWVDDSEIPNQCKC